VRKSCRHRTDVFDVESGKIRNGRADNQSHEGTGKPFDRRDSRPE
jgi:hypothetical protein